MPALRLRNRETLRPPCTARRVPSISIRHPSSSIVGTRSLLAAIPDRAILPRNASKHNCRMPSAQVPTRPSILATFCSRRPVTIAHVKNGTRWSIPRAVWTDLEEKPGRMERRDTTMAVRAQQPTIRIELTAEQQEHVRRALGREGPALELTSEQLEEHLEGRIAPG